MTNKPDAGGDARLTRAAQVDALRNGDILGQSCTSCNDVSGVPAAACPSCGSRTLEPVSLPSTGKVYTETTIRVPPTGFEGPYQIAVVSLGPARVTGRIDGHADIGHTVVFDGVFEHDDGDPVPVFVRE